MPFLFSFYLFVSNVKHSCFRLTRNLFRIFCRLGQFFSGFHTNVGFHLFGKWNLVKRNIGWGDYKIICGIVFFVFVFVFLTLWNSSSYEKRKEKKKSEHINQIFLNTGYQNSSKLPLVSRLKRRRRKKKRCAYNYNYPPQTNI